MVNSVYLLSVCLINKQLTPANNAALPTRPQKQRVFLITRIASQIVTICDRGWFYLLLTKLSFEVRTQQGINTVDKEKGEQ